MKFVQRISFLSAAALLAVSGTASAAQTPAAYARRPPVEVASGAPVRVAGELVWHSVPAKHQRAWQRLRAAMGPRTWAVWDRDTDVVRRIWGAGIPAPDALASAEAAERHAREFLAAHLALLAPGAAIHDLQLVANDLHAGMRTVGFTQRSGGLPVDGGQLSFRFKNDRLFMIASEALPHVPRPAARVVSDDDAAAAALAWVRRDTAPAARVTGVQPARVLPLIRGGRVDYATVVSVVVESVAPRGRWLVHVDAVTGAPVARAQTLKFADGTVKYNAPVRGPSGQRMDYPASRASVVVNGQNATTTAAGGITWNNNNPAAVTTRARGDLVLVNNDAGGDATDDLNIGPGQTGVWNAANNVSEDAQVTTFVHVNLAKDYVRAIDPGFGWNDDQINAIVNINDSCNAFYDGQLNFFSESAECNNTGRVADIVYHEYGHGVHDRSIIEGVGQFEGALSEGVSDYLCATINDDPAMAVEFFKGDPNPLRHIDPPNSEAVWPDDINPDTHETGLIIAGALWDLRKALIADQGPGAVAQADHLYYQAIRRAVDIPSMYFEVVAADDDDGDLANGTPNLCLINVAFSQHGLYSLNVDVTAPGVAVPQLDGYEVAAAISGGSDQCGSDAIESADLTWRLREDPNTGGVIAMDVAPDKITATIPKQAPGTVVQYQLKIVFSSAVLEYPQNRADPFYEFFVGTVEDIYCTDFETDPAADGWTHGLTEGENMEGADDWKWGVPMAPIASGDPQAAYDGTQAFGNDLGGGMYNGTYQPDKTNFAQTPAIDTTGYSQVRLQYRRWLNVEDGHFDQAKIYANGQVAWNNLATPDEQSASVHHTDREWRFHDVDLTPFVANDSVQLKYEINSDAGLEMGGWTLDAFCVVGVVEGQTGAICGDGIVTAPEECDDGNQNGGDGCAADCTDEGTADDTGDVDSGAEGTGTGGGTGTDGDGDGGTPTGDDGETPTGGPDDGGGADESGGTGTATAGEAGDEGCGCRETAPTGPAVALVGLGLLGLRRRRR